MTRIHTIILVGYIALLLVVSSAVAAQKTTTASVPTEATTAAALVTVSESSNKTTYHSDIAGDYAVRIISVEYVNGAVVFILEPDLLRTVTVTAPIGLTSTGAAARNLIRRPIPLGRTTIRVGPSEPRVTLVTSYPVENGRYTEIRFDNDGLALTAGPFTGTDVQDVAIGGALDTSFGAFLVIVRQRFSLHRNMERVV